MKLTIEHHTHYTYQGEVRRSTQYLRLTPQHSNRQRILSWELDLPESATCTSDSYGNVLHVLTLDQPHEAIHIHARGVVEILDAVEEPDATHSPLIFLRHSPLTQPDAAIRQLAERYHRPDDLQSGLEALMHALLERMPYSLGAPASTRRPPMFRRWRRCLSGPHPCLSGLLPFVRFASPLCQRLSLHAGLHVATHAWAEVWYLEQWHTFDVTNQCTTPTQHLKLAVGIDYLDACPGACPLRRRASRWLTPPSI